jgi:DNA-binding response OmpR family regulator
MERKSLRVVVVDDNRDIVATTIALLAVEGHDAKACYDGSAVLPCIREFDPDVVVMDIGLPGKSGWDAARELRNAIPGKRPLLIGVSGEFTKGADKALSKIAGFDYYLVKPADPKVLLALVHRMAEEGCGSD